MTLRDYLRVLFRQKSVVITAVVTVIVTVFIGLKLKTSVYQSQVKMLISAEKQIDSPYYKDLLGYRNVEVALTQSEIVRSNPVIERSVKAVGLYQRPLDYEKNFCALVKVPWIKFRAARINARLKKFPQEQKQAYFYRMAIEDLKQNIKVEPIRDTNMFTISVSDFSPIGSAILANIVSRSYVIFDLEQQLAELQLKYGKDHPTVIQLKDSIDKMAKSLNGQPLSDIDAIGPASVKIVEQATVPLRPMGIPKPLTMVLAVFMSVFLGVMLAFVFEYLDQTFKSPQDIETSLNLPYLGSIPKKADVNAYQDLADQIYLLMKDNNLKTLLCSAAYANEGVTTIIFNLGSYLSKVAGHKVLIIDANFRNPGMNKLFKLADVNGLSDVLENKTTFEKAVKDLGANLHVLVSGKTALNPITLLGSHSMSDIIKLAKEKYEIILIDCADLSDFKDSLVLSASVDGVTLVVTEGQTRRQAVTATIAPLKQKNANLIGVILRNRSYVIPKAIYDRV
jgi:capsular exopolysaccharide synthesis family protein